MCDLNKRSWKKEIIGYKIVVAKNGRLYSPAMGCRYLKDGPVTPVKKQKAIGCFFNPFILEPESRVFEPKMIGRSAVFMSHSHACYVCNKMMDAGVHEDGYEYQVWEVAVSKNIRLGTYRLYCAVKYKFFKVAAGRHLRFIKQLPLNEDTSLTESSAA